MSYAPNTIRSSGDAPPVTADDAADYGDSGYEPARERPSRPTRPSETVSTRSRPVGRPYEEERDWGRVGLVGLGLTIGALIGVGIALLYAPQSGEETRAEIRRTTRRLRERAVDAWGDLGDDVRWKTYRGKKRLRRGVRRGSWKAEDVLDAGRRRVR